MLLQLLPPLILGVMARLMLEPPEEVVRTYRIPGCAIEDAYPSGAAGRPAAVAAVAKPRRFLCELGLVPERFIPLWERMGIWPDPSPIPMGRSYISAQIKPQGRSSL